MTDGNIRAAPFAGKLLDTTQLSIGGQTVQRGRVDEAGGNTGAVTKVAAVSSAVTLSGSNSARRALAIHNDSPNWLHVKYGSAADWVDSFSDVIAPFSSWVMPVLYTGIVTGSWKPKNLLPSANGRSSPVSGYARVSEITLV